MGNRWVSAVSKGTLHHKCTHFHTHTPETRKECLDQEATLCCSSCCITKATSKRSSKRSESGPAIGDAFWVAVWVSVCMFSTSCLYSPDPRGHASVLWVCHSNASLMKNGSSLLPARFKISPVCFWIKNLVFRTRLSTIITFCASFAIHSVLSSTATDAGSWCGRVCECECLDAEAFQGSGWWEFTK